MRRPELEARAPRSPSQATSRLLAMAVRKCSGAGRRAQRRVELTKMRLQLYGENRAGAEGRENREGPRKLRTIFSEYRKRRTLRAIAKEANGVRPLAPARFGRRRRQVMPPLVIA